MPVKKVGRREVLVSLGVLAGHGALAAAGLGRGGTVSAPGAGLTTSPHPLPEGRPRLAAAVAKVDELFAAQHARDRVASITAGVISGGELIWTNSYGLSDIEHNIPATADTVYRIGSITKQFTAIAFLQLVKLGKVRLTDPAEKYFPEINRVQGRPAGTPPITLLQLATHTSGLDREPGDVRLYTTGPVSAWEETLIAALPHTRYAFEPGTRQVYSNIGFAVLGAALSRAANEPYIDYVRRNIIEPLGQKNTRFEPDVALQSRLAKGYVLRDGKPDPEPSAKELKNGRGYKVPNGALFTTVADLARLVSFELGNGPDKVLPRDVLEEHQARVYSSGVSLGSGFGIGFSLIRSGDLVIAGHGGSVAGFVAGAYFHRASQTGLVYFRNYGQGLRDNVVFDAFRILTDTDNR
jgi:D-alanyl-D-alanine carboxypeptidase